jgi:hypothetical protein
MLDVDNGEAHSNIETPRLDTGILTPVPPDRERGDMTPRSVHRDDRTPGELVDDSEDKSRYCGYRHGW